MLLFSLSLQHVCCDCKKDFCSVCSVLQENLRRCSTCHLLQETAFQRPQLMRLKVKDLRQYLILRNIPIDTCREKEDLVDLVLCHHRLGSEDDLDTSSLNSSRSQTSSFFTHSFFFKLYSPVCYRIFVSGRAYGWRPDLRIWSAGTGTRVQLPQGPGTSSALGQCGGAFRADGSLLRRGSTLC